MKQASLAIWLKLVIVGAGICGVIVYTVVIPALGQWIAVSEEGYFDYCYWPWLGFIWATGVPCFTALVLAWRIAGNIGADQAFSSSNAKWLKWISGLALGDAAFFLAGNVVLLFLNMNHPGILLFSLIAVFAGVVVSVGAGGLSQLTLRAAALQRQVSVSL